MELSNAMMYFYSAVGLVLLFAGGEVLVRGAVSLAERLCVPKLVIGLTVVALGTSAPELIVCVEAAMNQLPGIAFGNVIGSNIANVLMVIGLPALIFPIVCDHNAARRDGLVMVLASVIFVAFSWAGRLDLWQGLLFTALLAGYIWHTYYRSRLERAEASLAAAATEEIEQDMPHGLPLSVAFIIGGLVALMLGSHFLIDGATAIASAAGVSNDVIGLTLVALGTSLPELATTVIAAIRRHGDVAIGNVLGSNLFNLLGIMGVTAIVTPVSVPEKILQFDMWVMIFVSALLIPLILTRRPFGRAVGVTFIASYLVYVWAQFNGFSGVALAMGN